MLSIILMSYVIFWLCSFNFREQPQQRDQGTGQYLSLVKSARVWRILLSDKTQCQQVINSGKGILKCISYGSRARELLEGRSSQQGGMSHTALPVSIHSTILTLVCVITSEIVVSNKFMNIAFSN